MSACDMMDGVRQVWPTERDRRRPISLSGFQPGKSGGFGRVSDPPWRPSAAPPPAAPR